MPCSWVWGLSRIAAMAAIPAPCACVECMRPAAQAGGPRTAERRAVLPARPSGPAPVLGDAGRGLRDAKSLETHSASDQGRPNRKAKSISGARKSLTSASPTWNCLWHLARHCPLRMQATARQDGSPGPPAPRCPGVSRRVSSDFAPRQILSTCVRKKRGPPGRPRGQQENSSRNASMRK